MATDITKSIENSLLELQKNAKEQIPKIVNTSDFAEKVYGLMLGTLIEVERSHNEAYAAKPEDVLEHSSLIFNIANANEEENTYSLISLAEVENIPKKLDFAQVQSSFNTSYHDIIAECNANHKVQNFKIPGMEISTFYNQLTVLISNNKSLASNISQKAIGEHVITIALNLSED